MACQCDLPVIIRTTKRGWSRGEWSEDAYCGNCGEAHTPRGQRPGRRLSRKERSAKAKARYGWLYRTWIKNYIRERDYWRESHYYILGGTPGVTRFKVTQALKPSWTNIGKKVHLTKGVIYDVVQDPNDDFLSKASVCLYAPRGDKHSEVTYYRVQPGEVKALRLKKE